MELYLVTGGAGFIGSHIVESLLRRGIQVRILDNFLSGKEKNLEPFRSRIDLTKGDIRIATDHSSFDYKGIAKNSRLIVDTRNAISKKLKKVIRA